MFLSTIVITTISLLAISAFLRPASLPTRGRYLLLTAAQNKIFIVNKNKKDEHRIRAGSFQELVGKVRKQRTTFKFADLLVKTGDLEIDSECAFNDLQNNVDHTLTVESKSHKFSHYNSLQLSREHLQIEEVTHVFSNQFPDMRHYSNFPEVLNATCIEYARACRSMTAQRQLGVKAGLFISLVALAVVELIQSESDTPESYDHEPHLLMNFEQTVTGRRAHGKLDYAYALNHAIVTVLEAKQINAAVFQLASQFRAIYDETLRRYCKTYTNLSEDTIAQYMEKYPNYGVVSTADRWSVVRYSKIVGGEFWKLEQSEVLPLSVSLGSHPDMVLVREQIAHILGLLAGMVTCGMRDMVKLEEQLHQANIGVLNIV